MVAVQPQSIVVCNRDFVKVGRVALTKVGVSQWRTGDNGDEVTRDDVFTVIYNIRKAIVEAGIGSDQVAEVHVTPYEAAVLLAYGIIDMSAYIRSRIFNDRVIFGNAIITCRTVEVQAMLDSSFETITACVKPAD